MSGRQATRRPSERGGDEAAGRALATASWPCPAPTHLRPTSGRRIGRDRSPGGAGAGLSCTWSSSSCLLGIWQIVYMLRDLEPVVRAVADGRVGCVIRRRPCTTATEGLERLLPLRAPLGEHAPHPHRLARRHRRRRAARAAARHEPLGAQPARAGRHVRPRAPAPRLLQPARDLVRHRRDAQGASCSCSPRCRPSCWRRATPCAASPRTASSPCRRWARRGTRWSATACSRRCCPRS